MAPCLCVFCFSLSLSLWLSGLLKIVTDDVLLFVCLFVCGFVFSFCAFVCVCENRQAIDTHTQKRNTHSQRNTNTGTQTEPVRRKHTYTQAGMCWPCPKPWLRTLSFRLRPSLQRSPPSWLPLRRRMKQALAPSSGRATCLLGLRKACGTCSTTGPCPRTSFACAHSYRGFMHVSEC